VEVTASRLAARRLPGTARRLQISLHFLLRKMAGVAVVVVAVVGQSFLPPAPASAWRPRRRPRTSSSGFGRVASPSPRRS
jgi:hypothetical protein